MGFWNWKYNASDIADWFDAQDEKYWRDHDEWLIQSQLRGETRPIFVFATWASDRITTFPQRMGSGVTAGLFDVLRLGNDIDFNSGSGIAKGVFLNLARLATIAGPASKALAMGGRFADILATSELASIKGAVGPCSFVSINNVLSFMRGRSVQLFATVEDIVQVAGKNSGIGRETLLASEQVQSALAKFGVNFERLSGINTIDDVLRAARSANGPIVFGVRWVKNGETVAHALTAVRDVDGSVRLLDYVDEAAESFRGFASIAEMVAARPQWGEGFAKAVLNSANPVVAFSSGYLRLLKFADGGYRFGLPAAMGVRWLGSSGGDTMFGIARSAWRFLKSKHDDGAPIPPTPSVLPNLPATPEPVPSVPDQHGKRLGVSPVSDAASKAPRIDWLTGVQYRLKYLGYYKGHVNGENDQATKSAVLAFQKDWLAEPKEWDAIPGPITQGMLYGAVGW